LWCKERCWSKKGATSAQSGAVSALDELLEKSLPKKIWSGKKQTRGHAHFLTFLSIGGMNKSEGLKTVWKSGRFSTVFIFPQPLKDLFLPPHSVDLFFYFQKLEP